MFGHLYGLSVGEMMLNEQVIPIDFGQGVDTKTDPKQVVAGKFVRLENGVFTNIKRIAKRNGYMATGTTIANVGTLSSPKMVHNYNNELIAADQNLLLTYSPNQDAWESRGSYTSVELNRTIVSGDAGSTGITDVAILNNYALYGYGVSTPVGNFIYGRIVDLSTGAILLNQVVDTASPGTPVSNVKCALLGGTVLSIFYQSQSTGNWSARTIAFSGSGVVSFSGATVITSNISTTSFASFDLVETATGAACIYPNSSTPGITIATISTALAVSTVTIAATIGDSGVFAISKTSNGNLWAYWTESTSAGPDLTDLSLYCAIKDSSLGPVASRTLLIVTGTPYCVSSMIAKADSASQQTLYYGQFISNNASSTRCLERTRAVTVSLSGSTITPAVSQFVANGVIPFSHPFTVGSKIYAVFIVRSANTTVVINGVTGAASQSTLFVLELTNFQAPPYVVARFSYGTANSYNGYYQNLVLPQNVASFSSTKFYFNCGVVVQTTVPAPTTQITGQIAAYSYSFDFSGANTYIAKNAGQLAVLNGAVIQVYDGANCTEFGYHLAPEITWGSEVSTGGHIEDGEYNYMAIYQWIDNQGNLHQSAPSRVVGVSISAGTGTSSEVVTITTNFLTRKQNSWINLYRTTGAGSTTGSLFYLVNQLGLTSANSGVIPITTYTDILSDADLILNQQAYSYPGSPVLENTTPPPSTIMLPHNNRLWFADAENPNDIWYTKSFAPGTGLSPSGFLFEQIDPKFGNIADLSEMDEKLIIGKQSGFFIQAGDGANDTGSGSTLSFPQIVPSDVGVSQTKGTILTPNGIMFKSPNGIYLLTRALQVVYVGAEVEAYNSQTITGASLVPGKSQIRFLCSSGLTLVHDYIFNQWSTFTNHTGYSSTVWNSTYVYATTGGSVFKETPGSYLDNATAYSLLAQTSWLGLAGIQGFQRVKRLIMLGDFVNGNSASHNLSVSAAYDFSTTFQTAITYAFGAALASGVFQYRERLPIQKCDTISLLIQETTSGSTAEYVDLTNISFEAGVKKGVNKLGGLKSVG